MSKQWLILLFPLVVFTFLIVSPKPSILGDTTAISSKRIEVNLTNQKLYAYENGKLVYEYLISSGTWDRTPVGDYQIWTKIRSQKMSGGSKENGTYYFLPKVPYILFFYNESTPKKMGYSIHGTYWHNNFGTPMSHGCINMKTPEAKVIYDWAEVGTPIVIYGKYTKK
ncbi:MAG TPA: L,D-transpeptidase [Candidatus Woesebacteria bacterium]|nr:L,D-transpeptidase [Candidatus Woesebacteria bacterium]